MSVTEEQLRTARSERGESARRGGRARDMSRAVRLRPLLAAGVVLLLWFAWLLVPSPSDPEPVDVPPAGEGTARDGIEAQLFGDGPAAADGDPGAGADAVPSAEVGAAAAAEAAAPATAGAGEAVAGPSASPAEPSAAPVPPAPVVVPQAGEGTFAVAPGGSGRVGSQGTLVTYSVEVEDGVPVDVAEVAAVVDAVLADPRSWTAEGEWSLRRTDTDPDVHIRVTSPDTTDRLCAPLRTRGQVSCRNGDDVVLNALRWTRGATPWGDDVTGYREYLVNHELGHYLGMGHVPCPAEGAAAPVMLQQTLGLQGCAPNGWPFP